MTHAFPTRRSSYLAAAIAALNDASFLEQSYELNKRGKQILTEGFARLGLEFVPSYGNFVLVRVGDAARINLELLKRGVIVRPVVGEDRKSTRLNSSH